MKDPAYLLARSNYNSAKMAANNAIELVTEMATRMHERTQGNATASVLRQCARRLQGGMDKAEEAVDGQILLGTELVSLSSYLALLLADSDSVQAGQADQIQLSVGAEIKPLRKNLDKIYDDYATLFDMAGEQVSSQGSSACSSRAVSLERKRNHFNEFIHLKPSHLLCEVGDRDEGMDGACLPQCPAELGLGQLQELHQHHLAGGLGENSRGGNQRSG